MGPSWTPHRAPQLRRELERYDGEYRRNGTANLFVSRQTSLWIKVRAHRRSRRRLIRFLKERRLRLK
jgi:hypothetical protein